MNQNKTEHNNDHKPFGWIIHPDQIPRLIDMPDKYLVDVARVIMSYCYYGEYDEPEDPFLKYAINEIISRVNLDQKKSHDSTNRSRKCRDKQKAQSKNSAITEEEKIAYADHVTMTESQYNQLVSEYGEQDTRRMIAILNNQKCAKGVTYESDYHAILKWVVEALREEQQRAANAAACSDPEEYSSYDLEEVEDYWNKR